MAVPGKSGKVRRRGKCLSIMAKQFGALHIRFEKFPRDAGNPVSLEALAFQPGPWE